MNAEEKKCFKGLAACHTKLAAHHRANDNDEAAGHHETAAGWCMKLAALPAGTQGGDGEPSTINTNADGDAQAKRSTEAIDALLQKDRSAEFGKTPISTADEIGDLARELAQ